MNSKYRRADDKLCGAVRTMALHPGRLQQRLHDAFEQHLIHVQGDDFPPELRDEFAALYRAVTKDVEVGSSRIAVTCENLPDDEAHRLVDRVVQLRDAISGYYYR